MAPSAPGLLLIAAVLLAGCAPWSPAEAPTALPRTSTPEQGPPNWRSADTLVDAGSRSSSGPSSNPDYRLVGSDTLAVQLAERCAMEGSAGSSEDALIRELVADLYADGVDPGLASEAMIRSRCGEARGIVSELIAQGGDTAVSPVVERAVAAQGLVSVDALEQAAADGLRRWRRAAGIETAPMSAPLAGVRQSYSMIYFPLGGRGDPAGPSSTLAAPFDSALPGYGIYTFILHGGLGNAVEPVNLDTYSELLRVIETYVLAADRDAGDGVGGANRQAHSFLLPVHADRSGETLLDRTGPELSAGMRGDFAAYLRAGGQIELAQRLDQDSGPFLISSLEPRLVPADPRAPWMFVDLSEIGPEYMYSVVDAYDRLIPAEQVGRVESLAEIRARLIDMFPDTATDASAVASPAGVWLYLFGRRQDAMLMPAVFMPPVSTPGLLASVPGTARVGRGGGVAVTR